MSCARNGFYLHVPDWSFHLVSYMSITHLIQPLLKFNLHSQYPRHVDKNSSRALGICTGALTAAAVCCSRTVPELIPLGVHAIRVAFRIGILVADTARRIESPISSNLSWLLVLPGLKVAKESLDAFIELEVSLPPECEPVTSH